MSDEQIEVALDRAERGSTLTGTGFWRVVEAARKDRTIVERYGDRIAAIDRRAFERGVKLRVPLAVGLIALLGASVLGVVAIALALDLGALPRISERVDRPVLFVLEGSSRAEVVAPILFLAGTVALIVGTHSLAHWVVGRIFGIRFTHVFLGGPKPPRPGVKTDYATYLRATSRQRAVMHASGAVVTKIVPFALIPFATKLYAATWLTWVLVAIGVIQIVTDIVLSTKLSDWKKVRRELHSRAPT
jgi:hypothetical protein